MRNLAPILAFLVCLPPVLGQAPEAAPGKITLSIRDADLKDLLRAATEGTNLNLIFDPGIDTRVAGLDLKSVTLQELLDQVLPTVNLAYVRNGRTLHIIKSDDGMRYYHMDMLSLRREGTKDFQVDASGQLIQAGGAAGSSGSSGTSGGSSSGSGGTNSSAYTSSLKSANAYDPWQELQSGLTMLVFGEPVSAAGPATASGTITAPGPVSFSKGGKTLIIQPDSGLIIVGADPTTQRRVDQYLSEFRRRAGRQVLLEARIVEVTLGADSQVGVDWSAILAKGAASGGTGTDVSTTFTPGSTLNTNVTADQGLFQFVVQNARLSATLSALATDGKLKVLSSPRISTLNNEKAILRVVREEAYFLQNTQIVPSGLGTPPITTTTITPLIVPVGIILDIQPQIGDDGAITLSVNPSVSEVVGVNSLTLAQASATLPVVDRRDLDTVVKLHSGQTLVLAGIIKTRENDTDRGIPWLRRIPLLGNLFSKKEKSKTHTELAIFITPTLIEDSDAMTRVQTDLEQRLRDSGADLDPKPVKELPNHGM
jgi:MSHA biogenesis protein MshL